MDIENKDINFKKKIKIYDEKLLDVSSRNSFINFKFGNKIRIIDENPQIIYQKFLDKKSFIFSPLKDQENVLEDEDTNEFRAKFLEMKRTDDDYFDFKERKKKENWSYTKNENEELKILNALKDKVREKLGLTQVFRKELTATQYAKQLNLDPNFNLSFENKELKHEDNKLQVLFFEKKFADICKKIFDKYNTFIKETGNNPLYLCFGFLEWRTKNNKWFNSPILIFQIKMEKKRDNHYYLTSEGEDLENNFYIIKKLNIDYGIRFPKWESEEDDEVSFEKNLQNYYQKVEQNLRNEIGFDFKLKNQIAISTFDNTNMYIWKDFQKISSSLDQNKKIYQLLMSEKQSNTKVDENYQEDNSISQDTQKSFSAQEIEIMKSLPFEYDSSQFKIIKKVLNGQDLVIQGPPGTGKSQTICNLIASLAKQNKKILFVAQKEAALSVVRNKLRSKKYDQFMLNIFSEKANKAEILESINKRWKKIKNFYSDSKILNIKEYSKKISQISEYLEYWNYKERNQISNFDFLWKITKKFDVSFEEEWIINLLNLIPENQTNDLMDQEKDLNFFIKTFKENQKWKICFTKSLVQEINNQDLNQSDVEQKIEQKNKWLDDFNLEELPQHDIDQLISLKNKFNQTFNLSLEQKINFLISIFKNKVIKLDQISNYFKFISKTNNSFKKIQNQVIDQNDLKNLNFDVSKLKEFKEIIKKSNFFKRAFSQELKNEYQRLNLKKSIWFKQKTLIAIERIRDYFNICDQKNNWIESLSWPHWLFLILKSDDNDHILKIKSFFIEIKQILSSPQKINYFVFIFLKKEINDSFKTFWKFDQYQINKIFNKNDQKILEIIKDFFSQKEAISFWLEWKKISRTLNDKVAQFITIFMEKMSDKIKDLKELKYFFWFLVKEKNKQILRQDNHKFNLEILKQNLNDIKTLDQNNLKNGFHFFEKSQKDFLNLNSLNVKDLEKLLPVNLNNDGKGISDLWGWKLLREIRNKKRTKVTVHHIFERALENLLLMKPIFLMTSTAVAKFLPKKPNIFDVIIIDEASQMFPEHAISSIYRAKQVVITGDKKQLPPTNFFKIKDDEHFDFEESILELAEKIFPQEMLLFHYRSNHENLIKFSNKAFYENKLQVPSTSQIGDVVIKKFYFENAYYQGKIKGVKKRAGINKIEAQQLIDHVVETIKKHPDQSIGIVAMNSEQKKYLTEIFDDLRERVPELNNYLEKWIKKNEGLEDFFIKNLENVQGDERDIIYISTVYGKSQDEDKVYQRFGPISSDGGERRLNVLFTRAKKRIFLFTSLRPGDIQIKDTSKEGIKNLHNFLIYTEQQTNSNNELNNKKTKNDFHKIVTSWLQEAGFTCEYQIGKGAFSINIAVKHPQIKNNYLLAIENDGPHRYQLSHYRDRDVLRERILDQKYGWTFYNIWSKDYFENPEKTKEKLLKKCHQRLQELQIQQNNQSNKDNLVISKQKEILEKEYPF